LVPEKAPELLVRAFAGVRTEQRLVIAGGSSFTDGYVRSIRDLARADPRVIIAGPVYGEARDELYSNASCFVLPSSLEGLPLTLLEAGAYGLPVIVSDIPPHVEVVQANGPGHRLVRSGDLGALRDALARSLGDADAERAGAAELRASIRSRYDWDAATDATADVYERVLRGADGWVDLRGARVPWPSSERVSVGLDGAAEISLAASSRIALDGNGGDHAPDGVRQQPREKHGDATRH